MQMLEKKRVYKGYVEAGAMTTLIIGVGIAVLLLIFIGVLGGQAYSLTQSNIENITDATIRGYVKDAITSGFKSLQTVGQYMPLIVLAVVIAVILSIVLGFGVFGGRGTATAL
jgi:high-affinity Fe2+/Pb2+ permease